MDASDSPFDERGWTLGVADTRKVGLALVPNKPSHLDSFHDWNWRSPAG
jgi:hypothetical protein